MPEDNTEPIRRKLLPEVNAVTREDYVQRSEEDVRRDLETEHGQVWDTRELAADFEVHRFLAPFIVATRKEDSQKGSLLFTHSPRFYHSFLAGGVDERT